MGIETAIGLGLSAIGTATSVAGSLSQGSAAASAANASKHQSLVDTQKYQFNQVLAQYEAQRIKAENDLDTQYVSYAAERQASWLNMSGEYERGLAVAKADNQYTESVGKVLRDSEAAGTLAVTQARALESKASAEAARMMAATRAKVTEQNLAGDQATAKLVSSFGAHGVAMTGSAKDVVAQQELVNNLKSTSIEMQGEMSSDSTKEEARSQGNILQQKAALSAINAMQDIGVTAPHDNPLVQAQTSMAQIKTERDVALTEEEGWRTVMKMNLEAQNQENKTLLYGQEQSTRASSSLGAATIYDSVADSAENSSLTKAGTSLLTGLGSMVKVAKDVNWSSIFGSASGGGINWGAGGGYDYVPGSTRVADNY